MITNVLVAFLVYASSASAIDAAVRDQALQVLRGALETEARWVKVHAAEALLTIDDRGAVGAAFDRELAAHGSEPEYRIGIWRVLVEAADADAQRDRWVRKIVGAFTDTGGPDRLHASETLGKLGYRPRSSETTAFEQAARTGPGPLAANALWVLANGRRPGAEARLVDLLAARDEATRGTAAYAVRYLPALSPASRRKLRKAAATANGDNLATASLVGAAFVHAAAKEKARLRAALTRYARAGDADTRSEVCAALGAAGDAADVALLKNLLGGDANVDVRISAARALLQIDRRHLRGRSR